MDKRIKFIKMKIKLIQPSRTSQTSPEKKPPSDNVDLASKERSLFYISQKNIYKWCIIAIIIRHICMTYRREKKSERNRQLCEK